MTAVRYSLVDKKIKELWELFPKLVKPPVNLKNLMSALDIKFEEKDFEGQLSGAAIFNGNEMIVTVNSNEPESRKRFTVAHEIGHLLLHADQALNIDIKPVNLNRDQNSTTGESWREVEANYFAASLLMPKDDVRNQFFKWSELDEDLRLKKLAQRYEVSMQAMSVRLNTLGLISF
jgi:Zn-dependent peptidase ImmA (M78 family)